jgi:hypothetical protein
MAESTILRTEKWLKEGEAQAKFIICTKAVDIVTQKRKESVIFLKEMNA